MRNFIFISLYIYILFFFIFQLQWETSANHVLYAPMPKLMLKLQIQLKKFIYSRLVLIFLNQDPKIIFRTMIIKKQQIKSVAQQIELKKDLRSLFKVEQFMMVSGYVI